MEKAQIFAQLGSEFIPLGVGILVDVIKNIREPSKIAEEYLKESDSLAQKMIDTANAERNKNNG